jgi:hypothetical protein
MTRYAYQSLAEGELMTGVIEIPLDIPMGRVIEDILLLVNCSLEGELEGKILYLPLKN